MARRLRSLPWVEILLVMAVLIITCGQQIALTREEDTTWKEIELRHVLRVGMDPSYRPFEFWQDNQLQGFDVDLAAGIARRLGLEPQLVPIGMDSFYDALRLRQVDVVISALVPVPEYRKEISYSIPYLEAGTVLMAPLTSPMKQIKDLEGRRVAVEYGSDAHRVARKLQRGGMQFQMVPLETARQAAEEGITGKVDAVLSDGPTAAWFVLQQQLQLVAVVESAPYVAATRADNPGLLKRIDTALQELQRSGEIRRLELRWLQP